MANPFVLIKKENVLNAFAQEIELVSSSTQVSAELNSLKTTLHARWYQTPVTTGGTQKYVKPALIALKQDSTLLQSLTKYKSQKTSETRFNGKRAYKRYYLNADSILDYSEVNTAFTTTSVPWGADYRISGNIDTYLYNFQSSSYTRRESIFNAAIALSLNDYNTGSYHTSNDFRTESTVENVNTPGDAPTTNTWTKGIPNKYSLLTFSESGRYLITGRFLLRILARINTTLLDFDPTKIYALRDRTGANNSNTYTYLESTTNNVDIVFPCFRIKAIHYGADATMPNGLKLKNVFYSNVINYSFAGKSTRDQIAGIRFLTSISQGDKIQFILERTPFTVFYYDTTRMVKTLDAGCAYKKKDFDAYIPDRDKNNFIEVTRISGLLGDNSGVPVPSPTPVPTPTPNPNPNPTPTPTPNPTPSPNPTPTPPPPPVPSPTPGTSSYLIPHVIENGVDNTIYKVDFLNGHLGDVLPTDVVKSPIVGSETDGTLTGALYAQDFSYIVSNLDGWHVPENGLIRVLLSFRALAGIDISHKVGIGFYYPEYNNPKYIEVCGRDNRISTVGSTFVNNMTFDGKDQCYFTLDLVIDTNTNTGYMYLVSEDAYTNVGVYDNFFYPPTTTLESIKMFGRGQKLGITSVEIRTASNTNRYTDLLPYDYKVLNSFTRSILYDTAYVDRYVVLVRDNDGYMWISREGNTLYTRDGVLPPLTPRPNMTCTATEYAIYDTSNATTGNIKKWVFPFTNKSSTTISRNDFLKYIDSMGISLSCR